MNISIHATHRLPFFNATVTAKELSPSTTPVAFKLATGEEIGFEIRTNARGFICRTDGTPYNNGVFVGEDAIVTATLGDGSSTSWTVTSESEIVIFDGVLYGREAESGDDPDTLVKVGDKFYKKLFSANQEPNGQLSLDDLANVPSFTKWTDDQQIEVIDFKSVSKSYIVKVGLQTKVLILKPKDNTELASGVVFKLFLQATLAEDGESSRFGRNIVITNFSKNRVVLYNIGVDTPFGGLDGARSVTVTETYPNAPASSSVGGVAQFHCTESYQFVSGYQGVVVDTDNKLTITDGSTDIIDITQVQSVGSPNKTLNVTVDTSAVKLTRRVTLRRLDSYPGTLRLIQGNVAELGALPSSSTMELIIGTNYAKPVDEYIVRNTNANITLSESASQYPEIPLGCTSVNVDCSGNTSKTELHKILVNPQSTDAVRMEFYNASAPIWVAIVNSEQPEFVAEQFCIPAGSSRACVQLVRGAAKLMEKSWSKAASDYYNTGNREYILKYNTLDITFDLSDIAIRDRAYGTSMSDHKYDAVAAFPINSGEIARIRMKMPYYAANGGRANGDCRFGIGGHDNTFTLDNEFVGGQQTWYEAMTEENWFQLAGHIVEGTLTRSGTTYSFTISKVYALE